MDILKDVHDRLGSLGFDVSESDYSVRYAIARAKERILNDINCLEVPDGLRYTFIDMACGYYLHDLKAMGQIDASVLDLMNAPAKQIKEGDVQVTFAAASDGSLTPEARFDKLVNSLIHPDPALLAAYRRLVW